MKKRKPITIIFPKFQVRLVLVNLITSSIGLIAVIIQMLFSFNAMRELGHKYNLADTQPYFRFLDLQQRTLLIYLVTAYLIGCAISFIATIFYSHRVAGPLVRMKRYFGEIIKTGQIPASPLKFRKDDYLHDLGSTVQEAMEVLKK